MAVIVNSDNSLGLIESFKKLITNDTITGWEYFFNQGKDIFRSTSNLADGPDFRYIINKEHLYLLIFPIDQNSSQGLTIPDEQYHKFNNIMIENLKNYFSEFIQSLSETPWPLNQSQLEDIGYFTKYFN